MAQWFLCIWDWIQRAFTKSPGRCHVATRVWKDEDTTQSFSSNNYLVTDILSEIHPLFIALVYSKQRTSKLRVDKLWPMAACSQTTSGLRWLLWWWWWFSCSVVSDTLWPHACICSSGPWIFRQKDIGVDCLPSKDAIQELIVLVFLKGGGGEEWYFMTCIRLYYLKFYEIQLSLSMKKVYWNTAIPICLRIVYGWFYKNSRYE